LKCVKKLLLLALLLTFGFTTCAECQDLTSTLAAFVPLIGPSWIGDFISRPSLSFDHFMEWSVILDGQVVQWSKRVPEIGFIRETFFYWDEDLAAVAFTQLANNGRHGKGVVEVDDSVITLVGIATSTAEVVEFRQSFQITDDGTLEDRFFSLKNGVWELEHVIIYHQSQAVE